jgi:hypothetical protein
MLADLERRGFHRGQISGVLHMNGTPENCPPGQVEQYIAAWPQTDEDYRRSPVWTKTLVLRKTADLTALAHGSHCMFWHESASGARYYPWGYNHYKTSSQLDGSIAICGFTGLHHYGVPQDAPEWIAFEDLKARHGLRTTGDFTQAIRNRTLPAEFDALFRGWHSSPFEACKHYHRFAGLHNYRIDLTSGPCGDICCRYVADNGAVIQL